MSEFDKVFLKIDGTFRPDGDIFGHEWNEVRKKQIKFLLERPLISKVQTEKIWGPARLDAAVIHEWGEAEQEERNLDKDKEIEELADMTLLFLTSDSLNPNLMIKSQRKLLVIMAKESTVKHYCEAIGITEVDLIPACMKKIETNELRNPKEAFMLVPNEDLQTSIKRMEHNWGMLKKRRSDVRKKPMKLNWWKKSLFVDDGGWVREV